MKSSKTWAVATLATAACWVLSASAAQAASGYVSGYLWHYQNQGNYCNNDGRSCDGAQYVRAEFQTSVTVKNVVVYLRDQNDVVIGTGQTNTAGFFQFSWYRPTMPSSVGIFWTLKHSNGRFQVFAPDGTTYMLWVSGLSVSPVEGATTYLGSWQWGSSGAPHQLTNVYDGAEKMWRNSLAYSNRMQSNFMNLDIRALSDTVPYGCASSCALGDYNILQLDAAAAFMPQGRIMHEMGHIAAYKSNPHTIRATANPNLLFFDYCYPGAYNPSAPCKCSCGCFPGGCGGWNLNPAPAFATSEYRSASFEEGLATFFGDTAIYWHWNPEPYSCASGGFCPRASAYNVEASSSLGCVAGEDRWALSVDRYLRDMYDSIGDPGFSETMARPYSEFFDVLAQYPVGTGDHQKDETWNASYTALDYADGREASYDFGYNFTALTGLSSAPQYGNNCYP